MSDETSEQKNFSIVNVNSLNFGEMAKAAAKIVDSGLEFVKDFYEPKKIVERQEARTEAKTIKTKGNIKDQKLWDQAKRRRKAEAVKEQANIEAAVLGALAALPGPVDDRPISEDWLYQFINHVKGIGDEEMRSVWSKLLAGEATSPGKYSLLTMERLKTMRPKDAILFQQLKSCVWTVNGSGPPIVLTETMNPETGYWTSYVDANALTTLALHGLVHFRYDHGQAIQPLNSISYFDETFIFGTFVPQEMIGPSCRRLLP